MGPIYSHPYIRTLEIKSTHADTVIVFSCASAYAWPAISQASPAPCPLYLRCEAQGSGVRIQLHPSACNAPGCFLDHGVETAIAIRSPATPHVQPASPALDPEKHAGSGLGSGEVMLQSFCLSQHKPYAWGGAGSPDRLFARKYRKCAMTLG